MFIDTREEEHCSDKNSHANNVNIICCFAPSELGNFLN